MMKEELLGKIEKIRDDLDDLEEMAGKEKAQYVKHSVFMLPLNKVANMMQNGFDHIFQVGDVIVSSHTETGQIAWVVIGKDMDHDPEQPNRHTLTLQMRDVPPGFYRFDQSQPGAPWGRNAWERSSIRRWLNGDFLGGFTAEEQAAMIAVDKLTYNTSSGKVERTHDKLFLLSCTEVGFTPGEYIKEEGAAYPYFTGDESRRKVDNDGDARYWWLRSPYPGYAHDVRIVYPDGALSGAYARHGYGAAAACVIG